jgi:hypothetical protein
VQGRGEWASTSSMTFWGEIDYPWIQLEWTKVKKVNQVILYDRLDPKSHTSSGILHFSDGSSVPVFQIPNDGSPKVVDFPSKETKWIKFEVTDGDGSNLGLSEIEVYPLLRDM